MNAANHFSTACPLFVLTACDKSYFLQLIAVMSRTLSSLSCALRFVQASHLTFEALAWVTLASQIAVHALQAVAEGGRISLYLQALSVIYWMLTFTSICLPLAQPVKFVSLL